MAARKKAAKRAEKPAEPVKVFVVDTSNGDIEDFATRALAVDYIGGFTDTSQLFVVEGVQLDIHTGKVVLREITPEPEGTDLP